jgi:hypothetical protein
MSGVLLRKKLKYTCGKGIVDLSLFSWKKNKTSVLSVI